jgi:hypothetical protein
MMHILGRKKGGGVTRAQPEAVVVEPVDCRDWT